MGVDLKLLPFYMGKAAFSNDVISVQRNYDVFDQIKKLSAMKVPNEFNGLVSMGGDYEEQHWGKVVEDKYGDIVKYVIAKDLKTINISGPAGAYVKAMEDEHKIALFWC